MPMERVKQGMFARSKAGHDKDKLYIILKKEGGYVYLTDGELRPLSKPKRKNQKHIQPICRIPEGWDSESVTDNFVKRAIRLQEKEDENV